MALDFQQVHEQVQLLGEIAPDRQRELRERRLRAEELLAEYGGDFEGLRQKVARVIGKADPALRCAQPPDSQVVKPSRLDAAIPQPPLPAQASVLAADGSQIPLDRHSEVEYCLINVGAISMCLGDLEPPHTTVYTRLLYDRDLYTPTSTLTDALLALRRDRDERTLLASLAATASAPVITFTDGPIELWGRETGEAASRFQEYLAEYKNVLKRLASQQVVAAGYVDKPAANLVVRLLEVVQAPEEQLAQIREYHPLRGVTDLYLYSRLLSPGERSAVFALQSQSAGDYEGPLALHFFYLNVGREGHSSLARVEVPAWVARDAEKLDWLHAVLVDQCRMMGSRPYPYLLHRAHETAIVSLQEREQVTQMIALELRRRGVEVGERSQKQATKELEGRKRYS